MSFLQGVGEPVSRDLRGDFGVLEGALPAWDGGCRGVSAWCLGFSLGTPAPCRPLPPAPAW